MTLIRFTANNARSMNVKDVLDNIEGIIEKDRCQDDAFETFASIYERLRQTRKTRKVAAYQWTPAIAFIHWRNSL